MPLFFDRDNVKAIDIQPYVIVRYRYIITDKKRAVHLSDS